MLVKYENMARTKVVAGREGGEIKNYSHDGKVKWTVGVQPGVTMCTEFLGDMEPGDYLKVTAGMFVPAFPPGRMERMKYGPGSHDSGANPDYRPSRLTDGEKQLRKLIAGLQAKSVAMDQKIAQFEANKAKARYKPEVEAARASHAATEAPQSTDQDLEAGGVAGADE